MIAIIKYNAGNVQSVLNSVEKLGYKAIITNNYKTIENSKKIILPGVGEALSAMKYLQKNKLDILLKSIKQPILGICLGLQLMCSFSEEGNINCLGIFNDVIVKKFPKKDIIPHNGWNNFSYINTKSKLFKNISIDNDVYYLHSYYAELNNYSTTQCNYILPFSASLEKNNFYAVQFHPEKSGNIGMKILQNFLKI